MNKLKCKLWGHKRLQVYYLFEDPTIRYNHILRDDLGKALSWPICPRCFKQFVPVLVASDPRKPSRPSPTQKVIDDWDPRKKGLG